MTLQTERFPAHDAATTAAPSRKAPRGGSYVTLPAGRHELPRTEGTYITTPGGRPGPAALHLGVPDLRTRSFAGARATAERGRIPGDARSVI